MEIREQINGDTITVSIIGEIDGTNVSECEAALDAAMGKAANMVIDMGELDYISSAGLRIFLMLRKKTIANGIRMVIKNVTEDVQDIFSVTGFVKLLPIE